VAARDRRVALLGATGVVGREILEVLAERRFPLDELIPYASPGSAGGDVELQGEPLDVEPLLSDAPTSAAPWQRCGLVICAAPLVLEGRLEEVRESGARLVDVSGALELLPEVPLHRVGASDLPADATWVAVPRGAAAGVGLALEPLEREPGIRRASVVTLDPASGAGREGVSELSDQTVELLNAMTGETEASARFPRPLAFDCLPQVGLLLEDGETSEEQRLRHVVRRWLCRPDLALEVTRVRVPVFSGSLALVHVELGSKLGREQARKLWEARGSIEVSELEELPTPRSMTGRDSIRIGRVRADGSRLAFAVALDDLRVGSALAAVEAAEALCGGA
jgi:aspartate-semialdehyde dehydrogenase